MPEKAFGLYVTILRYHDADTFYGVIDQGFYSYMGTPWKPVSCRIFGIDTPELKVGGRVNPAAFAALEYARQIAPENTEYRAVSYKPPGLGAGFAIGARPVLDLYLPDGTLFRTAMLNAGHAVPMMGKTEHA
jgi:endonuclease YncB( thermonuclease family)